MSQQYGPPVETFSLDELEKRVNKFSNGKSRSPPINLEDCALKRFFQYKCDEKLVSGKKEIECKPVLRLFRQCEGGLTIETTYWEYTRSDIQTKPKLEDNSPQMQRPRHAEG